ncbi:MAG: HAMP domain-containing protein [Phycisphaerae bacterium]|nr:HAMP domain-containing protein [Phycisphaerae bacterium]
MRRHSFFLRLFAGNLLLVVVIISVSFAVSYGYLNRRHVQRDTHDQRRIARMMGTLFERRWPADAPPRREDVQPLCRDLMGMTDLRLTVMAGPDGVVLGDSEADPADMEPHVTADRPEVLAAMKGKLGQATRSSETLGVQFRYVAVPVERDGRVIGVVRVAKPVTDIARGQDFVQNVLLWAALTAAAVAVLLGLLISWLWYAPLRRIAHAARKIASGNLRHRAHMRGPRELSDLATALNEMRSSLATQMRLAARGQKNLQDVVSHIEDGIVALDAERNIVFMNHAAIDLLAPGARNVVGRNVQSVIRHVEVIDAINAAEGDGRLTRQVELDRGETHLNLDLYIADVSEGHREGICLLLTAHDVTEITRTARVKAEFVANASHELRTPLATIKATAESLAAVGPSDHQAMQKFIAMLTRHVQRLENLTNDLLDLQRLEQSRGKLRLGEIALGDLAAWIRATFAPTARDNDGRGVTLTVRPEPSEHAVRSDRKLVELILQNLLDNALKFTPAGGTVTCSLRANGDGAILEVADTGCGIPPEIRERVFERFFQADPSRSGAEARRGTGLGLAIVKHAAEQLGARVELHSRPGEGTTVTVFVPSREL